MYTVPYKLFYQSGVNTLFGYNRSIGDDITSIINMFTRDNEERTLSKTNSTTHHSKRN